MSVLMQWDGAEMDCEQCVYGSHCGFQCQDDPRYNNRKQTPVGDVRCWCGIEKSRCVNHCVQCGATQCKGHYLLGI